MHTFLFLTTTPRVYVHMLNCDDKSKTELPVYLFLPLSIFEFKSPIIAKKTHSKRNKTIYREKENVALEHE